MLLTEPRMVWKLHMIHQPKFLINRNSNKEQAKKKGSSTVDTVKMVDTIRMKNKIQMNNPEHV